MLEGLNSEQLEAVRHIDGPLLLLAGAGSGKTKTLTTRLAYLIGEVGIPASEILCLTFTNKASAEMRDRALKLVKTSEKPLLCTFHKFGLLFLKRYISLLNRSSEFVLLDSDDVKKVIKSFKSYLPPSTIMEAISFYKNQILSSQEVLAGAKGKEAKEIAILYCQYEEYLRAKNLLDFDDLLYLSYQILHSHLELAQTMSEKYRYIMVDEYQDTNLLQYKLLRLLCASHSNLCVVGDEDQSIYGWRGADIRNILEFEKDFLDAKMIKLEKNYRSTPQILHFANQLIAHNSQRLGKTLHSMQENGDEVEILHFSDEREEIDAITIEITRLHQQGIEYSQIAILYRLNALSRSLEEGLNRKKIPYRLIGAVRFYERMEVKDVLSYFRLMVNDEDDFSLLRVLNKPKRGIGKTSQNRLEEIAGDRSIYMLFCEDKHQIPLKTLQVLEEFFALIGHLRDAFMQSMDQFVTYFEEHIPLINEFLEHEREDRKANIDELFALLREFKEENPDASMADFLNELSLSSDFDKEVMSEVSCMSMHSSKGLEFDYVFVVGCEEGFFPLQREAEDMEEERRLGYVAFTRAKKRLYLSSVSSRFYKGKRQVLSPSRFLKEAQEGSEVQGLQKHSVVRHKVFGIGRILEIQGVGNEAKAKVNFGGNERMILLTFLEQAQ